MIVKPLDKLVQADIERLVNDQVSEGADLDYKRDLLLSTDGHKKELARDVSSLANAVGGDIVFGIEEAKDEGGTNLGYPARIVGVECANFDDTKLRIESIVRDNIAPRVHGLAIARVGSFELGPVIVLRVPKSWHGPHMLSFANQSHFYSRNGAGKYPLDVGQIRAAFLVGTEQATRIRRFRDARLGTIVAGETPVPLSTGEGPVVIIHVVPLSYGPDAEFDIGALRSRTTLMRPPRSGSGCNYRFNLDGFVAFSGSEGGAQRSYLQAFRNAAFEGVARIDTWTAGPPAHLNAIAIEKAVRNTVNNCVALVRELGNDDPISVGVVILNARGMRIAHDHPDGNSEYMLIDRTPLVLPDVLLSREDPDVPTALRPMFDALWQSSGWDRSYGYDDRGRWSDQAHR